MVLHDVASAFCFAVGKRDLASITSPFSSTTDGRVAAFSNCGGTGGHTYKFFTVLDPGSSISIGQTNNSFDSMVSVFWNESADPTSSPASGFKGGSNGFCTDDPDTRIFSMKNDNTARRKLWFVVNGYDATEYGKFTIAWTVTSESASYHRMLYIADTDMQI